MVALVTDPIRVLFREEGSLTARVGMGRNEILTVW